MVDVRAMGGAWCHENRPPPSASRSQLASRRPLGVQLRLFQNELRSGFLLVRRITVSLQDPFHEPAEVGLDAFAYRPVDRDVALHGPHELARDFAERLVPEHGYRTVVRLERVVKRELVFAQA